MMRHEENQMSWFSISSLKLVTCTPSLEISLQFFPWCIAPLSHFLWNGERVWERMTSCALTFIESLTKWINKSINQSTHKFSSEANVLGHWPIQVNEATHSSGDEMLCSKHCAIRLTALSWTFCSEMFSNKCENSLKRSNKPQQH